MFGVSLPTLLWGFFSGPHPSIPDVMICLVRAVWISSRGRLIGEAHLAFVEAGRKQTGHAAARAGLAFANWRVWT